MVGIFCLPTPSSGLIRFRVYMIDKHVDPHKAWVNAIDIGGRTVCLKINKIMNYLKLSKKKKFYFLFKKFEFR